MWKRKAKNSLPAHPDRVASRLAGALWQFQQRWARFMSSIEQRMPFRKCKGMVVLFVLVASSYSFYLIVDSIKGRSRSRFSIDSIRRPAHITTPGIEDKSKEVRLPAHEQEKINRFVHYMDSLSASASGRPIYDSILLVRPGLMDSIKQLQQL